MSRIARTITCEFNRWGQNGAGRGVRRPAQSSRLNLAGEMALRREKAFGVKLDKLMMWQTQYCYAHRSNAWLIPAGRTFLFCI